ncbi:MAG TPA: IS1-like element transposase [Chryseolinea sp.]|nr:IS1-like element transposase [Chryseolinea sp.]
MECKSCKAQCVKAGYTRNGTQRHFCKPCNKYQQQEYVYRAYTPGTSPSVIRLLREGVGIRSIARILKISVTTVTLRIRTIAKSLRRPRIDARQDVYEIDELWTFVGSKDNATWITNAWIDRVNRLSISQLARVPANYFHASLLPRLP